MPSRPSNREFTTAQRQALRAKEAAKAIGISERTLWDWTRDHGVPHFRIGNTVVYPLKQLDEWMAAKVKEQSRSSASLAPKPSTMGGVEE
jgi:excisionase family DNA binding protein